MSKKHDPYATGLTEEEREQARQEARKVLMRQYKFSAADRKHNMDVMKPTEISDPDAQFEDHIARMEARHEKACQKQSKPKKRRK